MINATQLTAAPQPDPTLSSLIPQRSLKRNLVLATAAVVALTAVWASPVVLRPSVVPDDITAGTAVELVRQHQVLTTIQLTAQGWPTVAVQSVGDVPGAKVAGAWVLPHPVAEPEPATTDPAAYATGLDYLQASFPRDRFDASSQLPHRLGRGESARLLILWDITDCTRLIQDQEPQIELGSILGTSTHQKLPDWTGPGMAVGAAGKASSCPNP